MNISEVITLPTISACKTLYNLHTTCKTLSTSKVIVGVLLCKKIFLCKKCNCTRIINLVDILGIKRQMRLALCFSISKHGNTIEQFACERLH